MLTTTTGNTSRGNEQHGQHSNYSSLVQTRDQLQALDSDCVCNLLWAKLTACVNKMEGMQAIERARKYLALLWEGSTCMPAPGVHPIVAAMLQTATINQTRKTAFNMTIGPLWLPFWHVGHIHKKLSSGSFRKHFFPTYLGKTNYSMKELASHPPIPSQNHTRKVKEIQI